MHNLNWHLHHLNASRRLAACRELKQPRSLKWKYLAEQTVPSHFQGNDFKKKYFLNCNEANYDGLKNRLIGAILFHYDYNVTISRKTDQSLMSC